MTFSSTVRTKTKTKTQSKTEVKEEPTSTMENLTVGRTLGSTLSSTSRQEQPQMQIQKQKQKQQSNSNQQQQSPSSSSQPVVRQIIPDPIHSSSESDFGKDDSEEEREKAKRKKDLKGKGKEKEVKKVTSNKRPSGSKKKETSEVVSISSDDEGGGDGVDRAKKRRKSSRNAGSSKVKSKKGKGEKVIVLSSDEDNYTDGDALPEKLQEKLKRKLNNASLSKSRKKEKKRGGNDSSSSSSWSSSASSDADTADGENEKEKKDRLIRDKHLAGRWRQKDAPESMNASRKKLEERYNPLIKLLRINIPILKFKNDDDSDQSSDDYKAISSDDEGFKPLPSQTSTSSIKPLVSQSQTSARILPRIALLEDVGCIYEIDDEPEVSTADELSSGDEKMDSINLPALKASSSSSSADTKPVISSNKVLMSDDSGEEISTQDEYSGEESIVDKMDVDVKPVVTSVVRAEESEEEQSTDYSDLKIDSTPFSSSGPKKPLIALEQKSTAPVQVDTKSSVLEGILAKIKSTQEPDDVAIALEQERRKHEETLRATQLARQADIQARQKIADKIERVRILKNLRIMQEVAEDEPTLSEEERDLNDNRPFTPYKQRKGKPKFEITSRTMDETPALMLGKDALGEELLLPACINRFLRPYQRDGVKFLVGQYLKGVGGILGDDMGLGKTIQIIATLSAIMKKEGTRDDFFTRESAIDSIGSKKLKKYGFPTPSTHGATCLIICPASVVHNWEREFKTWGYFNVGIYEGNATAKTAVMERFSRGYTDVVIAGYEAVRNNIDILVRHDFTLVIADEAHRIKNPKSKSTQALKRFKAPFKYGLTGTAVQNRLSEFHCCLDWCQPGAVGNLKQWNVYVTRPIQLAQKSDATDEQILLGRDRAQAIVKYLHPTIFLRRTKEVIKDQLPAKVDRIVLCPLTTLQKNVYKNMLASPDVQLMLTIEEPCECGATDGDGLPFKKGKCCHHGWSNMIFTYINLFQKISNHLALIYPDKEDFVRNKDKYEKDVDWAQVAFPNDSHLRTKGRVFGTETTLCGKWQILTELLDHWSSDTEAKNKVLIFSMSLKVLGHIRELMEFASTTYKFLCLDGSVPSHERMDLVDQFNNDPDVFCFLVSTKAGGVGLNLTAANKVVIFDPNWNPAHDLQAMDRAYRFGQTRDVDVYRLIGAGTLEELIYNRQQYKRAQANIVYDATAESRIYDGIQDDPDNKGSLWGVKAIFTLHDGFSLTKSKIEECQFAELEFSLKNRKLIDEASGKKKQKKKSSGKSSGSDSDSNLSSDEDEEDKLKEIFGIDVDGNQIAVSPEKTKRQKEQESISAILNNSSVAFTAISDSMLGDSKAEVDRVRLVTEGARTAQSVAIKHKDRKLRTDRSNVGSSRVGFNPLTRNRGLPRIAIEESKVKKESMEVD